MLTGGFEGLRSYRLGIFLIVYRFAKDTVEAAYVDHRRDVYR